MLQSHTPPIPPSPARLGLAGGTTTSSPSLPQNPNPNPSTKPQPPSASPAAQHHHGPSPTSAALLSLLPPLPRAQSLLHQMAVLSTKLFEISPHRAQWVSAFRGSLPTFLPSLPAHPLPSDSRPPSSTKEALSLFTSLQTQLFEAVAELQEIFDLQDSRAKIARDVRSRDATLLAFARKLKDAEQVLDRLVDDYSDYRRDPKRSKKESEPSSEYSLSLHSSLDLQEVLAYAHRISYTTFAPPEHGAGLAPLRGALPPAPQDNEMRASLLYQFADLDVGVLKKAPDTKERAADPLAEPLMEPTPPREEPVLPAIPPPMLPITLTPGWNKGMPVELPFELPPPPPGWKPGDPIVLPDGVLRGSRGEELRPSGVPMLPAMPVLQPKAPETIQVQQVILDIDQDTYSSDYSSEVGSSDEDDEE